MKLYVGNIPLSYTEEDLKSLFEGFNVKSIKLILDRETKRSRGFAFVEFHSKKEGFDAIKKLHETDCEGRKLIVNEARPQKKFSSRY